MSFIILLIYKTCNCKSLNVIHVVCGSSYHYMHLEVLLIIKPKLVIAIYFEKKWIFNTVRNFLPEHVLRKLNMLARYKELNTKEHLIICSSYVVGFKMSYIIYLIYLYLKLYLCLFDIHALIQTTKRSNQLKHA